jgi:hypothetical protein
MDYVVSSSKTNLTNGTLWGLKFKSGLIVHFGNPEDTELTFSFNFIYPYVAGPVASIGISYSSNEGWNPVAIGFISTTTTMKVVRTNINRVRFVAFGY